MLQVFARRPVHYLTQASVQACRLFSLMRVRAWHKKFCPEPQPFSVFLHQAYVHKVRGSFVRIKINIHPCAYLLLHAQCSFFITLTLTFPTASHISFFLHYILVLEKTTGQKNLCSHMQEGMNSLMVKWNDNCPRGERVINQ